jgi:uncharacterized protein
MEFIVDPSTDDLPDELDRYELVLLKWPAERSTISEEEAERIQVLHIAHLQAMTKSGAIRVAGPFDQQRDESLRGLAIYQTGSLERTRALANSDPAVVAGRLEVDVMYFYCPRGNL